MGANILAANEPREARMISAVESPADPQERSLCLILRKSRQRLHPETPHLGQLQRFRNRIGKPITQEELAEAVGVSRQWYAMIEGGAKTNVSIALLGRLADVLMLGEADRAALFAAGMPELARTTMSASAEASLEAYSWVRSACKRLWLASTEAEALTIATEIIAERFPGTTSIHNCFREVDGTWKQPLLIADARVTAWVAEFIAHCREKLGPAGMDALRCYPTLAQPGATFTEHVHSNNLSPTNIRGPLMQVRAEYRCDRQSLLYGSVRSRNDWTARIVINFPKRSYSQIDLLTMSTLTELTSLAIS